MSPSAHAATSAPAGTPSATAPAPWQHVLSEPENSAATPVVAARPPRRARAPRQTPPSPIRSPRAVILVGMGHVAQRLYFPALLELQRASVVSVDAIVDSNGSGFDAANAAFPAALYVGSLDDVTAPPDAIVILATPARLHAAQVNAATKRGWHVLCATPLAPNATEAALMIATARRHERLLAVDLRSRLYPSARYLRSLCHDHLLGPPINFRADLGQAHQVPDDDAKSEKIGRVDGALAALGAPSLDLLTWCLGRAEVASYADDAMGGVEANAAIELTFPEGVRGSVHLSRDWPIADAFTFVFERGIVHWAADQPAALTLQIASAPFALAGAFAAPLSTAQAALPALLPATEATACAEQLKNLIAASAGRSVPFTPATEAIPSLALIDECYARRSPLPQPWLSHNDGAHARALSPPPILRRP